MSVSISRTISFWRFVWSPLFSLLCGSCPIHQLNVGPFFTCFPIVVDLGTKFVTGLNLMTGHLGLFGSKEARVSLAFHGAREAVVRTVTGLGVLRASATRLTAFDCTFGEGAAAHWLSVDRLRVAERGLGWQDGQEWPCLHLTACTAVRQA